MNTGFFKPKDYTGQRFGICTAIKKTKKKSKDGSYVWKMKCDCGSFFKARASRFRQKWSVYSCGCKQRFNSGRKVKADLSGYKHFMATAIEPTDKRQKSSGYVIWKLKCDCGKIFERSARMLILKFTKSCGCRNFSMPKGRPKIPNKGSHVNSLYRTYIDSAKSRNIIFNLTKNDCRTLFESNCFYCGAIPKERKRSPGLSGTYANNGIDRIDSSIGYEPNNVVACCSTCNFAKSNTNIEDFKNWIKKIYHNFAKS